MSPWLPQRAQGISRQGLRPRLRHAGGPLEWVAEARCWSVYGWSVYDG